MKEICSIMKQNFLTFEDLKNARKKQCNFLKIIKNIERSRGQDSFAAGSSFQEKSKFNIFAKKDPKNFINSNKLNVGYKIKPRKITSKHKKIKQKRRCKSLNTNCANAKNKSNFNL